MYKRQVLHPFVVQLGRAARLAADDPANTQLDKLEAILAPSRIAETAPLFASLLSIPTGERYPLALSAAPQRRLTLAALLDQFEALARQKPVLMRAPVWPRRSAGVILTRSNQRGDPHAAA